MKYMLCKKQKGKGPGCGMTFEIVDYKGSISLVESYFSDLVAYPDGDGYFALEGEDLEVVWVIPMDQAFKVGLDSLREVFKEGISEKEKKERAESKRFQEFYVNMYSKERATVEKEERAEFERLKAKYK